MNTVINKLPFEMHLPKYQFCGPGTRLQKRLALGQMGVNKLDSLCRAHDIAYAEKKNLSDRHKADKILEDAAWEIAKSPNSGVGERAASWFVSNAMKGKRLLGLGYSTKKKKKFRVDRAIKKRL